MSELGQSRTSGRVCARSVHPSTTDMRALRLHVRLVPCITVSARSCAHGKWSVRLADCLSQGDFWPAETHRNPSGDKFQHELAGVTIIIRQVISELDATSSLFCHDPHFKGRCACRKAVPVYRQPVPLGEVEEYCRIATCGNDPPGRGIWLEPMVFKILLPRHTSHSILSISDRC